MIDISVRRHNADVVLVLEEFRATRRARVVREIELTETEARELIVRLETALCRGYGRDMAQVRAGYARLTGAKTEGDAL